MGPRIVVGPSGVAEDPARRPRRHAPATTQVAADPPLRARALTARKTYRRPILGSTVGGGSLKEEGSLIDAAELGLPGVVYEAGALAPSGRYRIASPYGARPGRVPA
jgi:hypothetical protein